MRHGFIYQEPFDPGRHLVVALPKGLCTLIDAEDAEIVARGSWSVVKLGPSKIYVRGRLHGQGKKELLLHRVLMGATEGVLVDHRSGDTLDNRRSVNLRFCTAQQNTQNKVQSTGRKTPFKGVVHFPYGPSCWKAVIRVRGRQVYLGAHKNEEAAARAYDAAALKYHGEFAATNVTLGLLPPLTEA